MKVIEHGKTPKGGNTTEANLADAKAVRDSTANLLDILKGSLKLPWWFQTQHTVFEFDKFPTPAVCFKSSDGEEEEEDADQH